METKKWSTKKKVLVSILVILCAAIIAGVLYMFFKPDPLPQVSTAKVTKGSITQTLDMSGKVSSSQKGNFVPIDGTKVLTVNVKVGEYVKKGDVLATFDTSSLSDVVAQKRENYNAAMSQYRKYASNANASVAQLESLSKQIEQKQREIEKLSEKVDAAKPKDDTKETISLKKQLTELLGDSKLAAEIVDRLFSSGTQVSEILQHLLGVALSGRSEYRAAAVLHRNAAGLIYHIHCSCLNTFCINYIPPCICCQLILKKTVVFSAKI